MKPNVLFLCTRNAARNQLAEARSKSVIEYPGEVAIHLHKGYWNHAHTGMSGERAEQIFAALCGALLMAGWLLETFSQASHWFPTSCYVASYFFGGYFTLWEAIEKLRSGKFEIDFLMIVAAAGAAALGAWAEGALLLFLFSIGHALEGYAMGRARRAIEALTTSITCRSPSDSAEPRDASSAKTYGSASVWLPSLSPARSSALTSAPPSHCMKAAL